MSLTSLLIKLCLTQGLVIWGISMANLIFITFFLTNTGNPRSSKSSKILVCKPKRLIQNFTESFEIKENYLNDLDDKNDSKLPPFVSKHHRVFHNSTTNLPQPYFAKNQPAAEDEIVPPWLKYITFIIHPKRRWP